MNAELVASLAQFQKRKAQRNHSAANFSTLSKPTTAPKEDTKSSAPESDAVAEEPSLAAVSKRIALFEKAKKKQETSSSQQEISIHAGTDPDTQTFTADASALRVQSRYIAEHFPRQAFPSHPLHLPDFSPAVMSLFLSYATKPLNPHTYTPLSSTSAPWPENAASAYLLALQLDAPRFEAYALSHFVQNCAALAQSPWRWIEDHVPAQSALGRFARYWVAWNIRIAGGRVGEYRGLGAVVDARRCSKETRDPRVLALEHWWAECGELIGKGCEHDAVWKKRKLEEKRRRERAKPAEWGEDMEKKAETRK